jgi:carboxyl-terminal processing protease
MRNATRKHRTSPAHATRPAWTTPVLLTILGIAVLGSTLALARSSSDDYRFFDPLIDVRALIARYAVDPPTDDELQRAAIAGMLEALDDPYATYVPPEFNDEFNKQLTGEYVGIGAEVNTQDDYLHIVTPLDGSPAFRAGVMAGDRVLAVDGESTAGRPIDESIDMLKGDPGTPVTLTVERDGVARDITVIRGEIKARTVSGFHRDPTDEGAWRHVIDADRGIAYVRISQFTPGLAGEVRGALERAGLLEGRVNGVVLDVRWNPGGLMSEAIAIADFFLDSGTIVSTKGRAHADESAEASPDATITDVPVAVLVNEQSASASEILAGALSENDRAIVVGTRSFGKGSVQSVRTLSASQPGAVLKLTEQRYYLPSGRSLQRTDDTAVWGVDPTPGYFVPLETEQLRELVTARREQEIIVEADSDDDGWNDTDTILERLRDPQLEAAVRALQIRIDTSEWLPTGREDDPAIDETTLAALSDARVARERVLRELARVDRRIDALESAAGDTAALAESPPDFIPDDAAIVGGTVTILDADGNELTRLRISNPAFERWLLDAGLEPLPTLAPATPGDSTDP